MKRPSRTKPLRAGKWSQIAFPDGVTRVIVSSSRFPRSNLRDPDSRGARKTAHGEPYQPGGSIPADATAQFGNLPLAVGVVGNLKRLACLERR